MMLVRVIFREEGGVTLGVGFAWEVEAYKSIDQLGHRGL